MRLEEAIELQLLEALLVLVVLLARVLLANIIVLRAQKLLEGHQEVGAVVVFVVSKMFKLT